jgi:hypothetical protein
VVQYYLDNIILTDRHQIVKSLRSRGFKLLPSEGWFQTIAIPAISSGGFKPSLFQPFQVVVLVAPQP